jgi:hypothetical protein
MNLRILFTICVVALIYGVGATDAQAVSLVELVATNGTVTADNVWFGHFTASISAQGNVSPTTLDQVTVLGGVPSIRFVGPFTARSPSLSSTRARVLILFQSLQANLPRHPGTAASGLEDLPLGALVGTRRIAYFRWKSLRVALLARGKRNCRLKRSEFKWTI